VPIMSGKERVKPGADRTWMTRVRAAEYLDISLSTFDRMVRDDVLTRHFIEGTKIARFHRDDLDKILIRDEMESPTS
jgi:excisionase family DNA binding protein